MAEEFTGIPGKLFGSVKGVVTSTIGKVTPLDVAKAGARFAAINILFPGSFWQNAVASVGFEATRIGLKNRGYGGIKSWIAASVVGAGINAIAGALVPKESEYPTNSLISRFSGRDDAYNTITGLRDSGLAQEARHYNTQFGSGYDSSRPLPTSLLGTKIDPRILEFREEVLNDAEAKAELEADIKEAQASAQENIGQFNKDDFVSANLGVIEGLNLQNRNLRAVNMERFRVEVEDADTILLHRKGLAGLFSDPIQVRLSGIDAPETSGHSSDPMQAIRIWQEQAGGNASAETLARFLDEQKGLQLIIDEQNQTYGRSLGTLVNKQNENINLQILRMGLASALPFGEQATDVILRSQAAQAEKEAIAEDRGIWSFARFRAIKTATNAIGSPITHNVLTEINKLAGNLTLGAYGSFLQSLGEEQRALTPQEEETARRFGYALRKTHGQPRFQQRWSGRDDNYNTIEGLRHGGMAEQTRHELTDFGSGFISETMRQDVFKRLGSDTGLEALSDISMPSWGKLSSAVKADPNEIVTLYHGTNQLYAEYIIEGKRLSREQEFALGRFGNDPRWIEYHRDLVDHGARRYASPRSFPFINSEAKNFFTPEELKKLHTVAFIETKIPAKFVQRQLVEDEHNVPIEFLSEGSHKIYTGEEIDKFAPGHSLQIREFHKRSLETEQNKSVLSLEKPKKIIKRNLISESILESNSSETVSSTEIQNLIGETKLISNQPISSVPSTLLKSTEEKTILKDIIHTQSSMSSKINDIFSKYEKQMAKESITTKEEILKIEKVLASKTVTTEESIAKDLAEFTVEHAKATKKAKLVVGGIAAGVVLLGGFVFSGKDDNYNTIEGLRHGGLSEDIRKKLTEFGSGWDALRGLARKIFKEESEDIAFKKLLSHPEFQSSLRDASFVKEVGSGAVGTARLMRGSFRGNEFKFVRKIGMIGEQEVEAMQAVQHSIGPTVYSNKLGVLDMEYFAGHEFGKLTVKEIDELTGQARSAIGEVHKAGFRHGDTKYDNLMKVITPSGETRVGVIDFGAAKRLSEFSPEEQLYQMQSDLAFGNRNNAFVPGFMQTVSPKAVIVNEEEDMFGAALTRAANPIPGKDNAYNTIRGLHPGTENSLGAKNIKDNTDFGSGLISSIKKGVVGLVKSGEKKIGKFASEEDFWNKVVKVRKERGLTISSEKISNISGSARKSLSGFSEDPVLVALEKERLLEEERLQNLLLPRLSANKLPYKNPNEFYKIAKARQENAVKMQEALASMGSKSSWGDSVAKHVPNREFASFQEEINQILDDVVPGGKTKEALPKGKVDRATEILSREEKERLAKLGKKQEYPDEYYRIKELENKHTFRVDAEGQFKLTQKMEKDHIEQAIERNRRFRKSVIESVGAGLKSAHNAAKKHARFSSTSSA